MKTKEQVATEYIKSFAGWHYLGRAGGRVELWKTPTMWLACSHYDGVFRFAKSRQDLDKAVQEVFTVLDSDC